MSVHFEAQNKTLALLGPSSVARKTFYQLRAFPHELLLLMLACEHDQMLTSADAADCFACEQMLCCGAMALSPSHQFSA